MQRIEITSRKMCHFLHATTFAADALAGASPRRRVNALLSLSSTVTCLDNNWRLIHFTSFALTYCVSSDCYYSNGIEEGRYVRSDPPG
jgi:hypothetical protein